jgi:hypothetical protein
MALHGEAFVGIDAAKLRNAVAMLLLTVHGHG